VRYLVDTSALVRIIRRRVDPEWYGAVDRGLIALCEPVLVETLAGVDAKNFGRAEADLRSAYPWVAVPDNAWAVVASVQRDLAKRSQHQGLSVADHLVVATGMQLKLTVLHEDADFETVSRVIPQLRQERISGQL
jgi:predicted nucleic acid-binding protein